MREIKSRQRKESTASFSSLSTDNQQLAVIIKFNDPDDRSAVD